MLCRRHRRLPVQPDEGAHPREEHARRASWLASHQLEPANVPGALACQPIPQHPLPSQTQPPA